VAALAAQLNYDAEAIFHFVADEIHYESYAGVMRGAKGTLWARAGNSADQAVLLGELLAAAQIPFRFAMGELQPEATERLAELIAPSAAAVRDAYESALRGSLQATGAPAIDAAATPAPLTAGDREFVDQANRTAESIRDRAATLIDSATATVTGALARANITLPPISGPTVLDIEQTRHTWVQVSDGPDWFDRDPTFPDEARETIVAADPTTFDALPEDLLHRVQVRLVVEEVFGGFPSLRDALSFEAPSTHLVNVPIALAMTGKSDMSGLGLSLNDLFSGTVSFVPCLVAGPDIVTATTPIVFGAGEGSGLSGALDPGSDGALADGETTGVWLIAEVTGPDGILLAAERTLLDRVGFETRATGAVDLSTLAPLEFITDQNGQQTVPELAGLTMITVDVARSPSLHAMRDTQSADLFGQLHLFGPSHASLRTALAFEHGLAAGFESYPSGPNLTSFSVHMADPSNVEAGLEIATDLLIQHPAIVALGDRAIEPDDLLPYVMAGVIDQVAEQVLVEPLVSTGDGTNTFRPTVGTIFQEAERAGIEIQAVTAVDGLDGLAHSGDALARMRAAIELGQIVVVPIEPVTIGGVAVTGWWLIDPATGRTWDQVEDGRGYAGGRVHAGYSLLSAQTGYAKLLNNVRVWAAPFLVLGKCVGAVVAAAVAASDFGGSSDAGDAALEVLKNIDPKGLAGC
jgi:hypothetical protein